MPNGSGGSDEMDHASPPKVLVVDDNDIILEVLLSTLKVSGYRSAGFLDGSEALDHYRLFFEDIAAVILDLSLKGISGLEVLQEMHRINPSAKVLLITGYLEHRDIQKARDEGISGFLAKPFSMDTLNCELDRILAL